MKSRIVRIVVGCLLLVLGMVGLVLPLLQGWLFLGLGILILSADVPFLHRFICRLEKRIPLLGRFMKRIRASLDRRGEALPPCPPED